MSNVILRGSGAQFRVTRTRPSRTNATPKITVATSNSVKHINVNDKTEVRFAA